MALTSPYEFRSKWFEKFWLVIGPKMAASPLQTDHVEALMSRAHGTVLELGPGTGEQMHHFNPTKIDRVFGAEPNAFMYTDLLARAAEHGLAGKYTPIKAGAEPGSLLLALKNAGLIAASASTLPDEGLFDSIVAVKCLCSSSQRDLPATVAVIHALLKPGGEFLFFEHMGNTTDLLTRSYAWLLGWIWPLLLGGCRLNGKLDTVVMGMGGWETKDIKVTGNYQGFEIFRYVKGCAGNLLDCTVAVDEFSKYKML